MASQEHIKSSPERSVDSRELEAIRAERTRELERAHESHEAAKAERDHEDLENARHEIEKINQERRPLQQHEKTERIKEVTRESRKESQKVAFSRIMQTTQAQMGTSSRTFSKVIHTPAVEKTSEVLGSSVARPNAILSGAVFAFVLTLAVYLVAHWYGYTLSGFESIAAFILGWALGIIYDFMRVMVTGKKA